MNSKSVQKRLEIQSGPDVVVSNHGSISLFDPQTPEAREWMEQHTGREVMWYGGALVVEHRYVGSFANALMEDGGFTVA
jgi:hypothetical protein